MVVNDRPPAAPGLEADLALAGRFPGEFVWGVATSAFQIEGAAHVDGRGDSVWDVFCRLPGVIADGSNGDRACDHYTRYRDDVRLMAELEIRAYRFSASWPRVQTTGSGPWNDRGFAFYDRLIDTLLSHGIAPHLTLNHWDLPQALQEAGGWTNRDIIARFTEYALEVGRRFGNRLESITTHNEPWVMAILGHETGIFAPGIKSRQAAMQASHHLLVSHGSAVRALRATGLVTPLGIVLNQSPIHPATASPEDYAKARLDDGLIIRWYMDPLLTGSYPEDVIAHLGADAPTVVDGDMELIRQPVDFLGINYYTRSVSGTGTATIPVEGKREVTDMGWEVWPAGLTELLLRLHADYTLPPVYIMENGAAYADQLVGGRVADTDRIRYLHSHIGALADAIAGGVDVRGYFVWSLLDNFEWAEGYKKRFGIIHVDYETLVRTPKDSAYWYREFLRGARRMTGKSGLAQLPEGR